MGKVIKLTESDLKNIISKIISEIELGGDKYGGNVALRKLSFKSKWDFSSKHQGLTIEDVLKFYPKSIYWAYTHLERISFVDEILDILDEKYPTFRRINKPGIDKEQFNELEALNVRVNFWEKYSLEELEKIKTAKNINGEPVPRGLKQEIAKRQAELFRAHSGRNELSKHKLAITNQGHKNIDDLEPKN